MSKLNEYQLIQQHLNKDEKCFIDVQNYGQLMAGVQPSKTYVNKGLTKSAIDNKFDGLEQYLHRLVSKGINNLQVFLRRKAGTGQKLIAALPFRVDAQTTHQEQQIQEPMQDHTANYPALNNGYQDALPSAKTYNAVPVSMREELSFTREKLAEIKQERLEYKAKAKKLKNKLDEVLTQLKFADKDKEAELRLQAMEFKSEIENLKNKHKDEIRDLKESQKTFLDSAAGTLLVERGLGLAEGVVQKASGPIPQQQPLAAPAENFSEIKTVLLSHIKNPNFVDKNAEAVMFFIRGLATKGDAFKEDYENLLIKHQLKPANNE